jgi:hypothetical protein
MMRTEGDEQHLETRAAIGDGERFAMPVLHDAAVENTLIRTCSSVGGAHITAFSLGQLRNCLKTP